jgi:probable F420-dependent oxidoreductase
MRLGFALPQFGGQAHEIDRVAEFAAAAEADGAASLWVGDRLLATVDPAIGYGGRDGFPAEFDAIADPFALLTVAATATSTPLLGASVLNLPFYPPAVLARSLTAIDRLSGGRLLAGFGLGWSPEEFQAVNVPFTKRGERVDESLAALEQLWTSAEPEYHGKHWTVPASRVALRPARKPPVYLGSYAEAGLRRIGERADGWLPAAVVPGRADAAPLLAARATIDSAATAAGRSPSDVDTVLRFNVAAGVGLDTLAEEIRRLVGETGFEHAFVDLMYVAGDVDTALAAVHRLTAELL